MSWYEIIDSISRGDYVSAAYRIKDIVMSSIKDVSNAYSNAVDMISAGMAMLIDDIKDFPRLDRPHHWIWGIILMIVGVIVLIIAIVLLILR
jgi:hypothetical protein